MNDPTVETALIEQFELRADAVGKGALAASHHDGAQKQMALVDQARSHSPPSKLGTPD